jgi:hypothetical protein
MTSSTQTPQQQSSQIFYLPKEKRWMNLRAQRAHTQLFSYTQTRLKKTSCTTMVGTKLSRRGSSREAPEGRCPSHPSLAVSGWSKSSKWAPSWPILVTTATAALGWLCRHHTQPWTLKKKISAVSAKEKHMVKNNDKYPDRWHSWFTRLLNYYCSFISSCLQTEIKSFIRN